MEFNLNDDFEVWGIFGITKDPSTFKHGRLSYIHDKGITLELPCGFSDDRKAWYEMPDHETIFGVVEKGTKVTLDGCFTKNTTFSFGSYAPAPHTIVASFMLCNEWIDDFHSLDVAALSNKVLGLEYFTDTHSGETA